MFQRKYDPKQKLPDKERVKLQKFAESLWKLLAYLSFVCIELAVRAPENASTNDAFESIVVGMFIVSPRPVEAKVVNAMHQGSASFEILQGGKASGCRQPRMLQHLRVHGSLIYQMETLTYFWDGSAGGVWKAVVQ